MDLSPEERQRIYLEEKARLEAAPKTAPASRPNWLPASLFAVFLSTVALTGWYYATGPAAATGSVSPAASPQVSTVAADWYCGEQLAAVDAVLASAREDTAAIVGMVVRGKLARIEQGARVHVYYQDGPLSRVRVESGLLTGESCWLPTKVLR